MTREEFLFREAKEQWEYWRAQPDQCTPAQNDPYGFTSSKKTVKEAAHLEYFRALSEYAESMRDAFEIACAKMTYKQRLEFAVELVSDPCSRDDREEHSPEALEEIRDRITQFKIFWG